MLRRGLTPEIYASNGRKKTARTLGWCPPDRLRRYFSLRSRVGSVEARRRVTVEMAEAERARIAAMTPFERQLERVRNGAKLVPVFRPRAADLDYTPGGVASGLL